MKNFFLSTCLFLASFTALFAQSSSQLKVGDKAPAISVEDINGNKVNLKSIAKKQKVLLVFLRYAWCPICNVRTHELMANYDKLKEKGYEVVVFYQSKATVLKDYATDKKFPYITVSNEKRDYYQTYGLEYNEQKVSENLEKTPESQPVKNKGLGLIGGEAGFKKFLEESTPEGRSLIPGDFIIDNKGRIERLHYGAFLGDHLPLSELLK